MKKTLSIQIAFFLFVSLFLNAQVPQKMSYQAIIRNAANNPVVNTSVGMRISILQNSASGSAVYVETQTPTTNSNGLISIEIGGGAVFSGGFASINWAAGNYFIKTETDPTGGTNYTIAGTSQLLSVPYALYAKTAESLTSTLYSIGLNKDLGGYIFYLTPDGKHGLVCDTQDQSTSCNFQNAPDVVNIPDNHSIDGKNFTDWRLPTKFELTLMYLYRNDIGGFNNNGGYYWSSIAYSGTRAWGLSMSTGALGNGADILYNQYVRAVRSF